ncbi:MAG: prohibitin family protein [Chloroflexota bacterium]|nr:prohibitin family protein [Chloroflexota bacterium]
MNVATALRAIASVMWVGVIALIVLAVMRATRAQKTRALSTAILVLAICAVILTTISAGLVFVQPEERGVVISAVASDGYRENALQPGLSWIVPFLENVKRYTISKITYTMSIAPLEGQVQGDDSVTARTSDGQEIFVDASVIYRVDPDKVIEIHIAWQDRYSDDLVRPLSRGVIRDAVSQFRVDEVISTKRAEMTQQIKSALSEKLLANGLVLEDFILRNITFSPEYAASVEQKQIAEQLAQQAKFVVDQRRQEAEQARQVAKGEADAVVLRAEGDAEAIIIKAEADAEALNLIAAALQGNQDLLTYTYIQKLSPNIQAMLLPSDNPFLFPLPTIGPPEPVSTPVPTPEPTPLPTPTPTETP